MKTKRLTDPFTGLTIEILENNGNLEIQNPVTGDMFHVEHMKNGYLFPEKAFEYQETMTTQQAAECLGLSRMRTHALTQEGTLQSAKINGNMVIDAKSVRKEKERRENG